MLTGEGARCRVDPRIEVGRGANAGPSLPPVGKSRTAIVLCDFEPKLAGELLVRKGETIEVLQSMGGGWCIASNAFLAKGLVPESYIQIVETYKPPTVSREARQQETGKNQLPCVSSEARQRETASVTFSDNFGDTHEKSLGSTSVEFEPEWSQAAARGDFADHVLVYDSQSDQERRSLIFDKLRRAGLRVVEHPLPGGDYNAALLTPISEARLEKEAEFRQMSLLLKNTRGLSEGEAYYADFQIAFKQRFALKNGHLFSPLERQNIVCSIAEGEEMHGGAEVDLDALVAEGVFVASMALHSAERETLWAAWAGIRLWPRGWPHGWPAAEAFAKLKHLWPLNIKPSQRRFLPDLGFFQQPIHAVQAYFGPKIGFYFAWAETYTCWLVCIALVLLPLEVSAWGVQDKSSNVYIQVTQCVILGACTSALIEYWQYKRATLAYSWDVTDVKQEARPRPEYLKSALVGRWRLPQFGGHAIHGMQKKQGFYGKGELFVEDQAANEELVMNKVDRLKVYAIGTVILICLCVCTIVSTLMVLSLQMLWTHAQQFDDSPTLRENGELIASLIITAQIAITNYFFKHLAIYFTNVENHRIDVGYEDSLILKVTLFQACNSYFALFYIAFVKAGRISLFSAFGAKDRLGRTYTDSCGSFGTEPFSLIGNCSVSTAAESDDCRFIFVRGDCMNELRTLMISHLVIKSCVEILMQMAIPWLMKKYASFKRQRHHGTVSVTPILASNSPSTKTAPLARGVGAQENSEQDQAVVELSRSSPTRTRKAMVQQISDQLNLPRSSGTFEEFRPKVLQFGYVAMFAVAFPLGAVAAMVTNIVELRVDAYKFMFATQRPLYADGADDIGSWKLVMQVFSWLAIAVNVLVVAYASNGARDYIAVPFVAHLSTCELTLDDGLISDEARHFGLTTSWTSSCPDNYRNCFVEIGSVEWLPAGRFLDPLEETSQPYLGDGLCNPASALYNADHCALCHERSAETYLALSIFVIVVEHLLILLKLAMGCLVPNEPATVRRNEARAKFVLENMRKSSRRD